MTDGDGIEFRIGKLALGKSDILVVKTDQVLRQEVVEGLLGHLHAAAPDAKVIILERGFDLAVLTREEIDTKAV